MRSTAYVLMFVLAVIAQPAAAQRSSVSAPCADAATLLSASDRAYCLAIAQAVQSAQPLLGALIAQGELAPGTPAADRGDGRTGIGASVRFGAVQVRLPDVRSPQTAGSARLDHTAHALTAAASLPLLPGVPAAGLTGVGALRAVAEATWLPFEILRLDGLAEDAARIAWGVGAEVGVMAESRVLPALSLSLMYRRLGRVSYGVICPPGAGADLITGRGSGYDFVAGTCAAPEDSSELSFNLSNWSGRAAVAKRIAAARLAAGAGYDRYGSSVGFGLGAIAALPGIGERPVYVRASDLQLEQGRLSAFANAAVAFGGAGVVAEAGWLQGGSVVDGFADASAFDPAAGTLFGSVSVRVSF